MVEYALADVSSLPDPQADASALSGIPAWRQAYILRYRRAEDRRRSLGVWRLMERMLARWGFQARDVAVDACGKPFCDGVCFSLSHAGDLAMCAVSETPVGCDIEPVKDAPFEIAPRVFLPGERAYLDEAWDKKEAQRLFFTLWTLKESYMKMTGEGLALAPERLEIRRPASGPVPERPEIRRPVFDLTSERPEPQMPAFTLLRDGIPQPCTLFHGTYGEYEFSLCTAGPEERFGLCRVVPW